MYTDVESEYVMVTVSVVRSSVVEDGPVDPVVASVIDAVLELDGVSVTVLSLSVGEMVSDLSEDVVGREKTDSPSVELPPSPSVTTTVLYITVVDVQSSDVVAMSLDSEVVLSDEEPKKDSPSLESPPPPVTGMTVSYHVPSLRYEVVTPGLLGIVVAYTDPSLVTVVIIMLSSTLEPDPPPETGIVVVYTFPALVKVLVMNCSLTVEPEPPPVIGTMVV